MDQPEGSRQLTPEIVELIVQKYVENEDRNFSLFNFASDLRSEVEKRQEELHKLKDELMQVKKKKDQTESGLRLEQKLLIDQMTQVQNETTRF